ncbi:N-acetyl-gamma-glutamyl-phosphate reductase [Halochromatium glycolicum]|uniref:N-acetyl-gamma-glutamyl-phosphate reductase n=1 Tax=Halochromatium glycolicum TaxID=85075 RepID=A0AAJ0U0F7_9GAMM|nr:N-acetyl-gamma-glutamyl-phosphate reductase [Halochromatium glycolicum]MBK1703095.1 N-acetyl-gamma-glutamyl-phosphate reductase [Halochromatium glycolicum]
MISVGIVGGTGYTGSELLRLLVRHPCIALRAVTSRAEAGTAIAEHYTALRGLTDLSFSAPEAARLAECDLVFFATPNGTAMQEASQLLDSGVRVIDLAADFRLKDVELWQRWYGQTHAAPALVDEAVYGLPELNRRAIAGARLVANPGCYPTAVTLGLLPLLEAGVVDANRVIADVKSGVSGAGRKASTALLMAECGESFKAYSVSGHRHQPEIQENLKRALGMDVGLTFVPHLLPMVRGIEATLYATRLQPDHELAETDLTALYQKRYQDEPFVDVLPSATSVETRSVRGTNLCRVAVTEPQGAGVVVVQSVIDNLVKGAAGQAVQNMNIMFGWEETTGLALSALAP